MTSSSEPAGRGARLLARPSARYGLRATLLVVAVALAGIPFGLLAQQVVTNGPLTRADLGVATWLNGQLAGHPGWVRVVELVTDAGRPGTLYVVVGIPAAWLFYRGRRRLTVFLVVTCLGGGVVDTVVKEVVGRSRPDVLAPITRAAGKSFPSGHAMSATICYGALLLVFLPWAAPPARRWIVAVTVVLVGLIGITRLALGVHFLTDVVGGYILGVAWLGASTAAFEVWRQERGRRRTEPLEAGVEPEEVDFPDVLA